MIGKIRQHLFANGTNFSLEVKMLHVIYEFRMFQRELCYLQIPGEYGKTPIYASALRPVLRF